MKNKHSVLGSITRSITLGISMISLPSLSFGDQGTPVAWDGASQISVAPSYFENAPAVGMQRSIQAPNGDSVLATVTSVSADCVTADVSQASNATLQNIFGALNVAVITETQENMPLASAPAQAMDASWNLCPSVSAVQVEASPTPTLTASPSPAPSESPSPSPIPTEFLPAKNIWSTYLTVTGPFSTIATDVDFNPSRVPASWCFFVKSNTLYSVDNYAKGVFHRNRGKYQGAGFLSDPLVATIQRGTEYVYLNSNDGTVEQIDAATMTNLGVPFNTRRGQCADDQLIAPPAIQLYLSSNVDFQNAYAQNLDDLVFVITADQCGDSTHNRIYALRASSLEKAWVFNMNGNSPVGKGIGGCTVDYANNALYCSTETDGSTPTLWALDTLTGRKLWSAKTARGIVHAPVLSDGRIYVVEEGYGSTVLHAYDPAGDGGGNGFELWNVPLRAGLVGLPQVSDGFIALTDRLGSLVLIDSNGLQGAYANLDLLGQAARRFTPNEVGVKFNTSPALRMDLGFAYVGTNEGYVRQIDITRARYLEGTDATALISDYNSAAVSSITLLAGVAGGQADHLEAFADDGTAKYFPIPWGMGTAGN